MISRPEVLGDGEPISPVLKNSFEIRADFDKLPRGVEKSPPRWDNGAFGETCEEYLEHTD